MPPSETWVMDIVLPEQWTQSFGSFDPLRLLRIALLKSAVGDLALPHQVGRCLGCDAVWWMQGSTGYGAIPFVDVCAALGLSTGAVQRALRPRALGHATFTIHLSTLEFDPDASRAVSAGHQ